MKLSYALLFILCVYSSNVQSQDSKRITVQPGNSVSEALSKEMYLYDEFIEGKVFFRDGTEYHPRLNYNLFNQQIQFLNGKGDTLSLANENTLKYISIGRDTFYYDKAYFKILRSNSNIKLAVRQRITVADKQKIGAFGQPSSGAGIETVDRIVQINKLNIMENVIFSKETQYYIGDSYNKFIAFNRKNLFRMFSNYQNDINKYLRDTAIDFNNGDDLIKLYSFIGNLQK